MQQIWRSSAGRFNQILAINQSKVLQKFNESLYIFLATYWNFQQLSGP